MSLGVTLCFYLVIGLAVALAIWISEAHALHFSRLFNATTAVLFWPLYLPVLLAADRSTSVGNEQSPQEDPQQLAQDDDMATAITQVEWELDIALNSLHGWAEAVLSAETEQLAELRSAWRQQAQRVRDLDSLLSSSTNKTALTETAVTGVLESHSSSANRITASEQLRQENLAKLSLVRRQCHEDLMATLAWVRQLVTMIHLAHYTGAPASRADELVQQIASAVEGLSKGNG